jgi:hypothetical protein
MLLQLVIGSFVISLTIIVEAIFIGIAERTLTARGDFLKEKPYHAKTIISLILVTLWLMLSHSIGVWIWAATFLVLDTFSGLEPALYFSVVSFTTLGFGDVLLDEKWRLLSGLTAANGLLIFGLSTAFLVEFLSRVRRAQKGV